MDNLKIIIPLIAFIVIDILLGVNSLRLICLVIAGCCIPLSGHYIQTVTKNVLAEPYIIGTSSGATIGMLLSYFLNLKCLIPVFAVVGALIVSSLIIYLLKFRRHLLKNLILLGLSFNIFVGSFLGIVIGSVPSKTYQVIRMVGGNYDVDSIPLCCVIIALATTVLFLSYKTAKFLSSPEEHEVLLVTMSSLLSSIGVMAVGIVGFIGIVAPQLAKRVFLDKYLIKIPLIGALVFVLSDIFLKHHLVSTVPFGTMVSAIIAPIFVFVMIKNSQVNDNQN